MSKDIVRHYVELEKARWENMLALHGYTDIEIDDTSDGGWKDDVRDLGKVAFWKVRDKDGVIIHHAKFYDPAGNSNYHGTGVFAVGESDAYFRRLGVTEDEKVIKNISVNGRSFEVVEYNSGIFEDLLKSEDSQSVAPIKKNPLSSSV